MCLYQCLLYILPKLWIGTSVYLHGFSVSMERVCFACLHMGCVCALHVYTFYVANPTDVFISRVLYLHRLSMNVVVSMPRVYTAKTLDWHTCLLARVFCLYGACMLCVFTQDVYALCVYTGCICFACLHKYWFFICDFVYKPAQIFMSHLILL